MKKKLLLLAELDAATQERLEQHYQVQPHPRWSENAIPEEELLAILRQEGPEVLVVEAQALTKKVLEGAPGLKFIASVRTTPANIDLECCRALGIQVSTAPGRNAVAVVEMAVAFMLDCARSIPQAHHDIKTHGVTLPRDCPPRDNEKDVIWVHPHFTTPPYVKYKGMEISGKILGLIGFGAIGKLLAPKARAFDMRVAVYDPYVDAATAAKWEVEKLDFDAVLAQSDFVSLHAKVTPETTGMIGMAQLKKMKPSAFLINTARGALIKQDDLVEALRNRVIAGAALDVFEKEPLYENDPIIELDNVILTPHIGGATQDVVRHQSEMVLANAIAYAEGKPLPHSV